MDTRALSILFDTYWSSSGWKERSQQQTPPEDFAYAKKHGVMFEPCALDHATVISRLSSAVAKLTPKQIGSAFLSSLSTRRLDWRSALGSYAVFRHMPEHKPSSETRCSTCGLYPCGIEDLNVLNFERHKWGGVRHDYPMYAMLDLELFLKEQHPEPCANDIAIFDELVTAIQCADARTTSGNLHKVFPRSLKSNKAERDTIVAILGFCGALETKGHPGFSEHFVAQDSRALPDRHFVDMSYPACWWRRDAGFARSRLRPYFEHTSSAV